MFLGSLRPSVLSRPTSLLSTSTFHYSRTTSPRHFSGFIRGAVTLNKFECVGRPKITGVVVASSSQSLLSTFTPRREEEGEERRRRRRRGAGSSYISSGTTALLLKVKFPKSKKTDKKMAVDIPCENGEESKSRRPSQLMHQNSTGSPSRVPPNGIEKKKPFLIGVAGGTASGKVSISDPKAGIRLFAFSVSDPKKGIRFVNFFSRPFARRSWKR